MDITPTKQIGLAEQAYKGAPKGVAHVWPDYIEHKPRPHWSWNKTKKNKLTKTYNPEWLKKERDFLDSI